MCGVCSCPCSEGYLAGVFDVVADGVLAVVCSEVVVWVGGLVVVVWVLVSVWFVVFGGFSGVFACSVCFVLFVGGCLSGGGVAGAVEVDPVS